MRSSFTTSSQSLLMPRATSGLANTSASGSVRFILMVAASRSTSRHSNAKGRTRVARVTRARANIFEDEKMRVLLATLFVTISSCSIAFAGGHGEHGGWHGEGGSAWHHDRHGDGGHHHSGGRWWHGRWWPWGGSCWQWHSPPGGWVWTCR